MIVGRHDQRTIGLPEILAGDRGQPFLAVGDFMHAPLRVKLVDRAADISGREPLHDGTERRIPLAHNDLEPGGLHPGLLQLLVGTAGVDALMLTHVADEQHAVAGREAVEEGVQLCRTGEARFVQHVEMLVLAGLRVCPRQMPLQGVGRDAGLF